MLKNIIGGIIAVSLLIILDSCDKEPPGSIYDGDACLNSGDFDMDGICDSLEIVQQSDPTDPCDPHNWDTDMDGICNVKENLDGTDPSDPCDPNNTDTDGDGYCDQLEINNGWDAQDPNNPDNPDVCINNPTDTDMDGICDAQEALNGTDPNDPCDPKSTDTDMDGICDVKETIDGSDPNDPNDPNPMGNPDARNLLLNNNWQQVSFSFRPNDDADWIDIWTSTDNCQKDNWMEFEAGGNIIHHMEGTCNNLEMAIWNGDWELIANDTYLNAMNMGPIDDVYDFQGNIQSITADEMVLFRRDADTEESFRYSFNKY